MDLDVSPGDAFATAAVPAPRVVVIGYGSRLRSDDAVGRRVAAAVARRGRRDVAALAVHQLTPELAPILASAEVAIFVDAATAHRAVRVEPVVPGGAAGALAHAAAPAALLALALGAYGRAPRAYIVTVPAASFALGTRVSRSARRGVAAAVRAVHRLVRETAGAPGA